MIRLDRFPSAQYNRLTMSDPLEKRSLSQPSRLGSTANLKGEWVCDEDVIIQGHLQGKIDSGDHDIHIEREAKVQADIRGKNITILGKVTGNVTASGKILVGKEAKMIGNLSAPQIAIQDGAKFKGTVNMLPKTT
jgi:cytoskeletal protein CcmA (bactofilin family)